MLTKRASPDIIIFVPSEQAPIAQLDRAFDYESKGHRFESCWVHHEPPTSFALLAVVFCLRFAQAFSFLFGLFDSRYNQIPPRFFYDSKRASQVYFHKIMVLHPCSYKQKQTSAESKNCRGLFLVLRSPNKHHAYRAKIMPSKLPVFKQRISFYSSSM